MFAPMFGSHLSIAGNMSNALREAESLTFDTVQVFTKNQQQWKAKPLDPAAIAEWTSELKRLGWQGRTVSHASYLINLASPDETLWEKSVTLMRDEIERCELLSIPFLVHHPGSFTTATLDIGLSNIVRAHTRLLKETLGYRTVICFEGTAGSGNTIGGAFEHLATLRERIASASGTPDRLGFCLDTCHMHAAGYDLSTRTSADAVLDQFDALCGLRHVRALHLNDSKGSLASRLDRHTHIGCGFIGTGATAHPGVVDEPATKAALKKSGFAAVLNRPEFQGIPMILETPKEDRAEGEPWDSVNLATLRGLVERTSAPSRA
jgi:deoxyribonuclease-4